MRKNVLIFFALLASICFLQINAKKFSTNYKSNVQDTIIVKHKNSIEKSYEVGFYSKSYSYYWIVGKDTLDFAISAHEYERDKSMSINIFHKNPINLKTAIKNTENCLTLIKQDFNIEKLNYLYFTNTFIYYPDIVTKLSNEYNAKYGKKRIEYKDLNKFLLSSIFNTKMNEFLKLQNKKVIGYGIEKFNLIDKQSMKYQLPNMDLKDYPEYSISGMGISVKLDKK
ncbi:hypothetical protein G6R40_02685 [Chryseobacterium sp. POL2]|uniref:hypothetical protein n=1 Tax=Chryseobacterium sp. POL2 TaxID=2713414 RepID=UPI0013E1D000|nr:hypothetical protein [Chryseobacterium sp. POL2]QIG88551.1 hypothetical protein G6R40_02235 [Chryseobacterium sp. POL2]QIG88607.1 hypothetical protein G6R40_02530 [Chryseobacterium sp. POL2]QIG88613.1 hypothetical protein G6R40_02560 [Chryseobacterium sp. POL2]QIG88637.1 hypothetical protein G6R40_02685 [Chryseobacterium sp. POL2]